MQRERFSGIAAFSVIGDAVVISLSLGLAYLLVEGFRQFLPDPYQARQLYELSHYGWVFLFDLAGSLVLLYLFGFYSYGRTLSYFDMFIGAAKMVVIAFLLLIAMMFLLRVQDVSRLLLGVYAVIKLLLLFGFKTLVRVVLTKLQEHGYNLIKAVIIGTGRQAEQLVARLRDSPELGYEVIGVLSDKPSPNGEFAAMPIVGAIDDLHDILLERSVDEVFYALPVNAVPSINELVFSCEEVGVRFSVVADWFQPNIARTSLRNLEDTPLLTFSTTPAQIGQLLVKMIMDRVLTFLGLIVLSPLMGGIALAIKLSGPGPVLFTQIRSGLNGRIFKMFKFRTMVENAEQLREELEARNEMSGPVFKMRKDPRVTRVGRWLRKYSIDELPQLFNVLLGDMSLVGPRPPIPQEVAKYERWQRRRLSMKPGLTCFWQIGGRNEIDFDEWMELDLKYIDTWSLKLDIIILLKTIPVVLLGRGAR